MLTSILALYYYLLLVNQSVSCDNRSLPNKLCRQLSQEVREKDWTVCEGIFSRG